MIFDNSKCPICNNIEGGHYQINPNPNGIVSCSICGDYRIDYPSEGLLRTGTLVVDQKNKQLTNIDRALISHVVRLAHEAKVHNVNIYETILCQILEFSKLPTPDEQANYLIRFIGDKVSETGEGLSSLPEGIQAIIGTSCLKAAYDLVEELGDKELLKFNLVRSIGATVGRNGQIVEPPHHISVSNNFNLTLDGWKQYKELQKKKNDPMLFAVAHGFEELNPLNTTIELTEYMDRIRNSLPDDLSLAIGTTKELLEATMKTILGRLGHKVPANIKFQELSNDCFSKLGLGYTSPPDSEDEKHLRAIVHSAKEMIITVNKLRNRVGTGHGRAAGDNLKITATDASLVASTGMILCAWLLRRHDSNSGSSRS